LSAADNFYEGKRHNKGKGEILNPLSIKWGREPYPIDGTLLRGFSRGRRRKGNSTLRGDLFYLKGLFREGKRQLGKRRNSAENGGKNETQRAGEKRTRRVGKKEVIPRNARENAPKASNRGNLFSKGKGTLFRDPSKRGGLDGDLSGLGGGK